MDNGILQISEKSDTFGGNFFQRYKSLCESNGVHPDPQTLDSCKFATTASSLGQPTVLNCCIRNLKEEDVWPLRLLLSSSLNELSAVDIEGEESGLSSLKILQILLSAEDKLRNVDISKNHLGRDIAQQICSQGLPCHSLSLTDCNLRKLNLSGAFGSLHTLYLDNNIDISFISEHCFISTPKLARLSLSGSSISNLWTTAAALSKLELLSELRFQSCDCCARTTTTCPERDPAQSRSASQSRFLSPSDRRTARRMSAESAPNEGLSILRRSLEFEPEASSSGRNGLAAVSREISGEISAEAAYGGERAEFESSEEGNHGYLREESLQFYDSNSFSYGLEEAGDQFEDMESILQLSSNALMAESQERSSGEPMSEDFVDGIEPRPPSPSAMDVTSFLLDDGISEINSLLRGMKYEHCSPICEENHYRAFFVSVLPQLKVFDNLKIAERERKQAKEIYCRKFEPLANNQRNVENVALLLQQRETGLSLYNYRRNLVRKSSAESSGVATEMKAEKCRGDFTARCFNGDARHFKRETMTQFQQTVESMCVASSYWPEIAPMPIYHQKEVDIHRQFRPRQFEYSPLDNERMVVGTMNGEVMVLNHESGQIVGTVRSVGAPNSILGLCWLNKDPTKVLAGCDNGVIQLYDVNHMRACYLATLGSGQANPAGTAVQRPQDPAVLTFDDFEHLTSVHVNCTDQLFAASGYSPDVALYDLQTGKSLQVLHGLHSEHINVVKFAHRSPHLFASSSFDSTVKLWDVRQSLEASGPVLSLSSDRPNVMACFSPDDQFLLTSGVDNEVRQYSVSQGRLNLRLSLKQYGSSHNYTRSYYMNGRDYIITGSCEENTVKICCSKTGRMLRDIAFEPLPQNRANRTSPYVQSLRGDPWKKFNFSVLIAFHHPSPRSEIVKVNLMTGSHSRRGDADSSELPPAGLGA